mgnify:CR=1 FL=1
MNQVLITVITFLISGAVCITLGMYLRKKTAESKIKGAESEAARILANAQKEAENAKKEEKISNVRGIRSAFAVICLCFVVALSVFIFVLGNPDNFEGGDTANHPLNLLGTI